MEKTGEFKILIYSDGKRDYYRLLVYNARRRVWDEITAANDGDVHILLRCAEDIQDKIERGVFNAKK